MLFSYVKISIFLGNFQEGSTKDKDEKKKKKPSIYDFFANNPDQDIEI
jgi:beta-lactamase class D